MKLPRDRLSENIAALLRNQRGSTQLEYLLLSIVVVYTLIPTSAFISKDISTIYITVAESLGGSTGTTNTGGSETIIHHEGRELTQADEPSNE